MIENFEQLIQTRDLTLFSKIESQSTDEDKRSLLAVQLALRELRSPYTYLEIGSHLGGSIQPHLLDPNCRIIYSIDKRPRSQPDARGFDWVYENNSTERMIQNLSQIAEDTSKIVTIDGDTSTVKVFLIENTIDLCFIDGEHTDQAVVRDFEFCRQVLSATGAIVFHDAQITYNGISECLRRMDEGGIEYKAYVLPDVVFVVDLGLGLYRHPRIAERLVENHRSFLFALQDNDRYRRFATRFPFGLMRRWLVRLRNGNVSR